MIWIIAFLIYAIGGLFALAAFAAAGRADELNEQILNEIAHGDGSVPPFHSRVSDR